MSRAANETRPPKKSARSLPELRRRWRAGAVARFGFDLIEQLLALARRAAAVIRATIPAAVDVARAARDVAATVYAHRGEYRRTGGFRRRHLLAEARRHLARTQRGQPTEPGVDDRIVQAAIDYYCSPVRTSGTTGQHPDHVAYTAAWTLPTPPAPTLRGALDTTLDRVALHRGRLRVLAALTLSAPPEDARGEGAICGQLALGDAARSKHHEGQLPAHFPGEAPRRRSPGGR